MADEQVVDPQNDDGTSEVIPETSSETVFTQADIDRAVKDRLARERKKYADYNELKSKADKLSELEQAQLSDKERLEQQLSDITKTLDTVKESARQKTVESAIIREASKLNFNDPGDAVALISSVEFDENGNPVGIEEAVKQLAEQRKYLLKNDKQRYLEQFNPSGETQPQKETDEQRRARLYGDGSQVFTVELAEQHGGGIVWNEPPPKK